MLSLPENRSVSFDSIIIENRQNGAPSFASLMIMGLTQFSLGFVFVCVLMVFPTTAFAKSTCLLATADSCVLKTDYQGLKVQVDERGKVVVIFGNSKDEFVRAESYVNVQEDLMRLEASNDIEAGESKQIQNELVKYDGASYSIPDSTELLSALGFPETTSVTADDYIDLIKVHMQLVLSLSASAASYLSDLLGIESIESVPAPTPTPVATPTPTPAPLIGPAPVATPVNESTPLPSKPALAPVPLPSPKEEVQPVQPVTAPAVIPTVPVKPNPEVVPLPAPAASSIPVEIPAPTPVSTPAALPSPAPNATPIATDSLTPNRS